MKIITDFLSSPVWQGVQGLLALLAIIIGLGGTRKWLEERPSTKWLIKIPWIWLFVVAGIAAGISTYLKYQDFYRGISVAFITITLGLGIQTIQTLRTSSKTGLLLGEMTAKYNRLTAGLKRVVHLLPSEFSVADWRITHTIDDDGSDLLREELTIIPSNEPVYFYFKRYIAAWNAGEMAIKVSAENLKDNTSLSIFEVERIGGYVYYVILLDPPSTITSPKRIAITCEREQIWSLLLDQNESEGSFQASHQSDSIRMELLAPRGKKWKGFHPAPVFGDVEIETSGSISRISWVLKNAQPRKYAYQAYLENKAQ